MKVILSRKGFDSINGGMPSVIMPNGDLVSMPIPSPRDVNSYDQLWYGGKTYRQILKELAPKKRFPRCHLDPDIDSSRLVNKPSGWKPAFGQCSTSASYLLDTVDLLPNDIFLFFGNFRRVEEVDGQYRFISRTGDFYRDCTIQVIWGYLQVGEIIRDPRKVKADYPWHPHAVGSHLRDKTEMLVVPRKRLSFAASRPGCGLLKYDVARVLTERGASKAIWKFNKVYSPDNIIVSQGRKNSSRCPDCIYYSGYWQELGLKESKASERWCKRMILGA